MKRFKVLGTGCRLCRETAELIATVASDEGVPVEIHKIESLEEILKSGVVQTPAVLLGDRVVHIGGLPKRKLIEQWLKE